MDVCERAVPSGASAPSRARRGRALSENALKAGGDLDQFYLVREHLSEARQVHNLEGMPGQERYALPVRAMWNLQLAGIVFEQAIIDSPLREPAPYPSLLVAGLIEPDDY